MDGKFVAVDLRVSTEDQSHESQRAEVERWLRSQAVDSQRVAWYEDTASGRDSSRKMFDKLKADLKARRRTTVVVYALDRISRDFFDGVELLFGWLKAGVRVVSVTEAFDLSGEIGQAVAVVIFALASSEWRKRKARAEAGIKIAKAKGVYKGRKPGSYKADPQRMYELLDRGLRPGEVGLALGVNAKTVLRHAKARAGAQLPKP